MLRYILRRLAFFPPTLLGVSLLVFTIMHLTPGDPAEILLGAEASPLQLEQLRHNLGLDQPVAVQFAIFVQNAAQGDLGRSIRTNNPVAEEIAPGHRVACFRAGDAPGARAGHGPRT